MYDFHTHLSQLNYEAFLSHGYVTRAMVGRLTVKDDGRTWQVFWMSGASHSPRRDVVYELVEFGGSLTW